MLQCPRCPQQLPDEEKLKIHLERTHHEQDITRVMREGSGWYEEQRQTKDGLAAPEHQAAAIRAQIQKNKPLTIPIVPVETKKDPTMPAGWSRTSEGYGYEEVLCEKTTVENVIKKVLRAKVTPNHGVAVIYTYTKDVTELNEAREKEGILDARMAPLVPSDPKFVTMAEELHNAIHKVRDIKKNLEPKVGSEIALQDHFHGVFGSDVHVKWQSDFMTKVLTRVEEIKRDYTKPSAEMEK